MNTHPSNTKRPRFSWPMRIFLGYYLFDMFFRSLVCLTPADSDWGDELSMRNNPISIPTQNELSQIEKGVHPDGYSSKTARWNESFKSLARFFVPYPTKQERKEIGSIVDVGKYSLAWMHTRLSFVGRTVGVDQEFPMFSPNVSSSDTVGRLRLVYEDGSSEIYRLRVDPADLTNYSHWLEEKLLQVDGKVHRDVDSRLGTCMMLAHKFGKNTDGSGLIKIEVFKVHYDYPDPYVSAKDFLSEMTGPPADRVESPFWEYDVQKEEGRFLDE